MLRFAVSSTDDMNIGDLRVALFNYIVSQQKKEDLIIRIEDINKEKSVEGKDKEILGVLSLFGIEYSQVLYQSQNFRFHSAMALQLLHEKKAFSCFCSPQWLEKKREEAKIAKEPYMYDGACENLPAELVIDNENPFTIRIKKPLKSIVIDDSIKGKITFKANDIDSFIIMQQDKIPTYNFASAIDDMLSDISLVIHDEEHINNTPKQIHIRTSLNYDKKIEYAHIPTMLDENTLSVKWLLEEGYLPEAISNYLISTGNKPPKEIFSLEEAKEWFTLDTISKSPTHFDINMLKYINKEHLKNLDAKELSRYVGFADEEIGELARTYLEEVSTTKELKSKIELIFGQKNIPDEFKEQAEILLQTIKNAPYFEEYNDFENYIMKESGLKDKNFFKPLSLLFTGEENGANISKVYKNIKNYIGEIVK